MSIPGLLGELWTSQPVLGRLLECVRNLQHAPLVAVTANDLNANGKPGRGEILPGPTSRDYS
jgi:hypothetical protein